MKYHSLGLLCSALLLAGCNNDDYDINIDKINWTGAYGKTEVQLINASSIPLDFHIGSYESDGDAPDIKASKYRVGSLEAGQQHIQVKVNHNWSDERLSLQAFHRSSAQDSPAAGLPANASSLATPSMEHRRPANNPTQRGATPSRCYYRA